MDTTDAHAFGPVRATLRALLLAALCLATLTASSPPVHAAEPRVVGGNPVSPSEMSATGRWGAVVSLVISTEGQLRLCTGTMILPRWIVTAAHCLGRPSNLKIPVSADAVTVNGASTTLDSDLPGPQVRAVFQHPGFDQNTAAWDIALLQLYSDAPYPTMTLPDPSRLATYGFGTAPNLAGFGRTDGLDANSIGTLQEGRLEPATIGDCEAARPGAALYSDCMVSGPTRQMACFGDSGGPVVRFDLQRGGLPVLWGVTSIAPSLCQTFGEMPTFHTRVASAMVWIAPTIVAASGRPRAISPGTVQAPAPPGTSASVTLEGRGIRAVKTKIKRRPTRSRTGKVQVITTYTGGKAAGRAEIKRCYDGRCRTTAKKRLRFSAAKTSRRQTLRLPRCKPDTTIVLRLQVKANGGKQQARATKRIARCT